MYDAFISYSHAADGKLAPALQQGLQGFAKPWYRRRALRIFRDQTSLAATPELWPTIVRGLESARYFLLLASPEAAASRWVGREAAWWREHRSPQTMLIVLTGGELAWDEAAGDFDWAHTNALPDELRGAFPSEPLWVDLRWIRSETDISIKHPDFVAAVADLAATIRGVAKDDLVGEDVRQHRRTRRTAMAAIVALALLTVAAAGAGIIALGQRNEARRQEGVAQGQAATAEVERILAVDARATAEAERAVAVSRQLASQAKLLQDEDYDTALLLAVEATRHSASLEARQSLLALLGARADLDRYLWNRDGPRSVVTFTGDGTHLVSTGSQIDVLDREPGSMDATKSGVELWDLQRGEVVASIEKSGDRFLGSAAAVSPDGELLVLGDCSQVHRLAYGSYWHGSSCDRGTIQFFAAETLTSLADPLPAHPGEVDAIAFSADGSRLATMSANGVRLWDVSGRHLLAGFPSGLDPGVAGPVSLAFSPDGSRLAVAGPNTTMAVGGVGIRIWDVTDDHPRPGRHLEHDSGVVDVMFSDDSRRLVGGSPTGIFAWDLEGTSPRPAPLLEGVGVAGLALHRQSGILYAVDGEGTIYVLDFASGEVIGSVSDGEETSGAEDVAVAPDGLHLAVQSGPAVALWNWEENNLRRDLPTGAVDDLALAGWPERSTLRVVEDGRRVVDVAADLAGEPPAKTEPVFDVPSTDDEASMLVAAGGSAIAWAAAGAATISVAADPDSPPQELAVGAGVDNLTLTPDGTLLVATLDDSTIRAWEVRDLQALGSASPFGTGVPPMTALGRELVVSQAGDRLAVTASLGDEIAVLALPSLQLVIPPFALEPLTWATSEMTFSADGKSLIVAGYSGARGDDPLIQRQSNLSRWDLTGDVATGMILADGFGPGLVATSPDGRLLAYSRSYYQQKDIYLWDLEHGADLGWLGTEEEGAALHFSPESERLVVASAGSDSEGNRIVPRLAVYAVDLDAWRAAACRVAARKLTADEWRLYLGDAPQSPACSPPALAASRDAS